MKKLFTIFVLALISIYYANAQTPEFWGMTLKGGNDNLGVIFKTDSSGNNQAVVYSFVKDYSGKNPYFTKLCEASNGKLYGMTTYGGVNNSGVLFEYDPATDTYTKKLNFGGTNSGAYPEGSLMQASNGKLYGMTKQGGANGSGVLFEYDPATDTYTKKFDFDGSNTGHYPLGSLMQASNGKLYGMTYRGGANNCGVLFEYDPATDTYTKKIDFDGTNNGKYPYGSLMQASNGKLYGMTKLGGANNVGVLFEYDPATDTYTKKIDFDGSNKGSKPYGTLIQASNGKLYGMTAYGGVNSSGVLFEYDPEAETYTKKFDFDDTNGSNPYGSVMQASNGKLYGITYRGGNNNYGVLFEYDPDAETYTKKFDFDDTNGSNPYGSVIQASNSKLYGMTNTGGTNNVGVLFEYDPNAETYTKKLDFEGSRGESPEAYLMQASNGKLYGMTYAGGLNNDGVIFEYDPITDTYTKKIDFDGSNTGRNPRGSLMQASNGKLYGMTNSGGTNNLGVLFEYDPATDTYTKKLDFDGTNGGNPFGALMQASNGKLYGMTNSGGANNYGVLFEYDPDAATYTKKFDFDGNNNGSTPFGSLIQASNGKLYGMTTFGGYHFQGVLFEYDPANDTYTKKFDFGNNNGSSPYGSLMQASNGKLYGMTYRGGANNCGVLFEYDPATDTYTKKIDFDGTNNGKYPYGSLIQASNGKLYGMTYQGGANFQGVLFEYDPETDTYTKKLDFDGNNGSGPYFCALIETNICYSTNNTIDTTVCNSYTVPSGNETYNVSGTYNDTIPNACGGDSIITINLTVNYSQTTDITATACDTYNWHGNTYTESGDYNDTLQTIHGCDSVVTLHLTINTVDVSVTVDGTTLTANEAGASYQWIICSNNLPISGETNQSFTPIVNGEYAVIVDNGLCVDTSECIAVTSVGIAENTSGQEIKIYPNPTTGKITIDLNGEYQNISVSLKDVTGRTLQTKTFDTGKILDFSINQPAGFYLIEINAGENKAVVKLLKE